MTRQDVESPDIFLPCYQCDELIPIVRGHWNVYKTGFSTKTRQLMKTPWSETKSHHAFKILHNEFTRNSICSSFSLLFRAVYSFSILKRSNFPSFRYMKNMYMIVSTIYYKYIIYHSKILEYMFCLT